MQRRKLLLLAPLLPLSFSLSRHLRALGNQPEKPIDSRGQALKLNQLATTIHNPTDASLFVDFVADIFKQELMPAWGTVKVRERVAESEFLAVSGSKKLIPEQLAQAWNSFVQTINAPQEQQISFAEIHNLRDAFFSTANLSWQEDDRTIWTVPGIYAVQQNGVVADGYRAIESLRILWDLANIPSNLEAARARVSQGLLASEQLRQSQNLLSEHREGYAVVTVGYRNPIEEAARKFVATNGIKTFGKAVSAMLDQTLA